MTSRATQFARPRLLMGALQRLREMLWPRPERPVPAWAYAPAPGKRRRALPRPPTGPLAEPEWRPMWPGNRPRQQPKASDDADA
ncbi:MAG TPA: hypothetical protein VFU69_05020 [Ktedonobacterales bacterium]|nr:hypothetical protein [Ktedonobacterales bacterium]